MKYIKRIFEENAPIDVYGDVEDFKNMDPVSIINRKDWRDNFKKSAIKNIDKYLKILLDEHLTMEDSEKSSYYCIQDLEDNIIGYSWGLDDLHALLIYATNMEDPIIFSDADEYYIYPVNKERINNEIKHIEYKIKNLQKELNFYNKI